VSLVAGATVSLLLAAAAAIAVRRRWVVALAAVVWPAYFAGLHASWWGNGVGDGWPVAAIALTGATATGALLGLAVGRRRTNRPVNGP
jgi:hypothetical protein